MKSATINPQHIVREPLLVTADGDRTQRGLHRALRSLKCCSSNNRQRGRTYTNYSVHVNESSDANFHVGTATARAPAHLVRLTHTYQFVH